MNSIRHYKPMIFILFAWLMCSAQAEETPPVSLTASDGTGLEMRELKVRVVLDGITAFTELEMSFYNPENRQREGRFAILLPSNASVSRFAMKIGQNWQEGEVVEKQKARQVYEDFLHRRQDPALLEQDSGNYFRARVFPIPPNAEKNIILSYSELLVNNANTFYFPLKGLPKLGRLEIKAFYKGEPESSTAVTSSLGGEIKNWKIMSIEKKDFTPVEDFILKIPPNNKEEYYALRAGNLCAVRFQPVSEGKNDPVPVEKWVVLIDTSASQAVSFSSNMDRLQQILHLLTEKGAREIRLIAFDQDIEDMGLYSSGTGLGKLKERRPLGASNMENAFEKLTAMISDQKIRLLLVSDGIPTAGCVDMNQLRAELSETNSIHRTDALCFTAYRDEGALKEITLSGKTPGTFVHGKMDDNHIAAKLLKPVHAEIRIEVPDSVWFWPEKLEGIQEGEEIVVFAEVSEDKPFVLRWNGRELTLKTQATHPLLLKREWGKARILRLIEKEKSAADKDMKNAMHNEAIRLSTTERILCPYTALLVLETEYDYQRYNIDRNALSDILTIGPDGINVVHRKPTDIPRPVPVIERPRRNFLRVKEEARKSMEEMGLDQITASNARQESSVPEEKEKLALPAAAPASEMAAGKPAGMEEGLEFTLGDEQEVSETVTKSRITSQTELSDKTVSDTPPPQPRASVPERVVLQSETPPGERIVTITVHIDQPRVRQNDQVPPWSGDYEKMRTLIKNNDLKKALELTLNWLNKNPGDPMAYVSLGEVLMKTGDANEACRAYGSLIDLFPSRADIRRWAGERLMEIPEAISLAADTFQKAKDQRPDHPSGFHLLAMALLAQGEVGSAINTLTEGLSRNFNNRFLKVKEILAEDLSLILSSSIASHLKDNEQVKKIIQQYRINPTLKPQYRFILSWETDANDVDFHIHDKSNNHAFYSQPSLSSGGKLYADITQGYGPECFVIENPRAAPYRLQAHYYSRGPMGYGMGLLQILKLSDSGKLSLENRPFLIMNDQAFVNLGTVEG
ncbi:MAG: hypothetical protein JW774_13895 [Candidatus Aureabacteria bacterium]|nr:hypothetical protein [Candidatus Auribacterota bacterium]